MSDPFTPAGVTSQAARRRPLLAAIVVFLCAAVVVAAMVWLSEQGRLREQQAAAADLAGDHAHAIQRSTERTLAATYALAALVRQGQGSIPNFTATAREMLLFYPGAASLQLAPGGIVQHIVPLAGNEKAIGHNLLADPSRDKEAFRARDTGQLTLAGPFQLVQGGLGAVGRLPVFLNDSQGNPSFWGFTSVLIRFPEALKDARLAELEKQGFGYELWRLHPDTGQKQAIASSSAAALIDPVTRGFDMPNGSWQLSIAPLKGWDDPLGLTIKSALGLLFCTLLAYLAKLLVELKMHHRHLETLVEQRTAEIRATQTKLQATFDTLPDLVWLKDTQGVYLDCNPMFERHLGTTKANILGKTAYDFVDRERADYFRQQDLRAMESGQARVDEDWLTFAGDGRRGLFEITKTPLRNPQGLLIGVLGLAHEITEHRAAATKIQRLSQLYAALSRSNQAIVHCRSETELFERICHDVVQFGGMKMGWIGLIDAASGWVIPVTSFGEGVDYLRDIRVLVDPEDPLGQGPVGVAVRENRPYWCQDFLADPLTLPWRERATHYHWGACATLPLHRAGVVTGVFTLYAQETQAFDDDVRNLLLEMASDISFALDGFDRETRRQQSEERLRLAASVFTHSREAIMITDANGTIIDVNEAFSRITGYSHDEVLGQNPRILSSGRQSREHYAAMWRDLLEHGHWYGEIWNRRKNGEVYAEMQTISCVRDAQGMVQQYVSLFSDITQLKEHERQLERIAHFDALTGLPNRVLLSDRLHQGMAQAQRRGQKLAVAFLDIDSFKSINDGHGHEIGDQLLIALAARMKQALREGDSLARLGGDEFVAVLVDLPDIEASVPLLSRLLAASALPLQIGAAQLQVSASLGVTFFPQAEEVDADQLLRQADQAMYQAKLAGKNRYHVFDDEQDRSVRGHHESLERIRHALIAREFTLYYQPKVNMRTGAVIGVEALIRWQHPERGLLSPAVFLPVVEEHALAIEIGEWVIDTALSQIALWNAAGLDLPISVNVGARQLQQPDFVERLHVLLATHPRVRPGDLELEVLETSALEDVAGVSRVIEACREIGVMFALDDFGTGYSSLTYLKRLPVALLKIDQSFVRDMLDDPDDLSILEGVIGLATAFRRQVIAEGVETVAHGALLLQLGCELAQGYGIARPMPAQAVPGWLASWRPDPAWNKLSLVEREDLPVLFSAVEHRAWVAGVEAFLDDRRDAPPPLAPGECRFGQWLDGDGRTRHGKHPGFQTVDALHRRAHALAQTLCEDHDHGAPTQARRVELNQVRDELIEKLIMLVQEPRRHR